MERVAEETESAIETDDLFLAGFGLVRGGEIAEVEIRGVNGRRTAFFRIEGPAMDEAEREYYRGNASVNLQLLKLQVKRLKDVAFSAMREEERNASDSNQPGADRGYQGPSRLRRHRR